MTLQNGLVLPDRAILWADTCYVDPFTRTVIGYQCKAFSSQTFPCAVSMTTVGQRPTRIVELINERLPLSLVQMLEACEWAAREFVKVQPEIAAVRLLVAAWCNERDEPRLFLVDSGPGLTGTPFDAVELSHFVCSANQSAAYQLAVANGFTVERMLAIAEAQRAEPFAPDKGGFEPFHNIGGELMEFEVTREGVTHRVVRTWGPPLQTEGAN